MPTRLSKIDELTRPDHTFLDAEDDCYYLGEYTARAGYAFSATNDLIQNLKKPMDRRGRPEWKWKAWAINRAAQMLREVVPERWLDRATFVPVPPSKTIDHPDYDDRLLQVLQGLSQARRLDVRELVTMAESTDPAHLTQDPRDIRELMRRMRLEEALANPTPEAVIIFDDVLTTGAHFKAVQRILLARFPDVPMAGLFLARRAPEAGPI